MGLFTRNTMSLDDMAELAAYTSMMIIGYYHKRREWPQELERTEIINLWLEWRKHKANFWKLTKLALISDSLARMTVASIPNVAEILVDEEELEEFRTDMLTMSRTALLQQDIT